MENNIMEKYGWTYKEMLETPFHVILYIGFISSSKATHEKLKELKQGEKK